VKPHNYVAKHAPKAGAGRHLDKRKRLLSRKPKHLYKET